MPHCTLEYSSNIPLEVDARRFFAGLHEVLSSFDTIKIDKIKSRAVRHQDYFIGDGKKDLAFVYLQIAMFSGRDVATRKSVADKALRYLREQFDHALAGLQCSVNVEVREIERATFSS